MVLQGTEELSQGASLQPTSSSSASPLVSALIDTGSEHCMEALLEITGER